METIKLDIETKLTKIIEGYIGKDLKEENESFRKDLKEDNVEDNVEEDEVATTTNHRGTCSSDRASTFRRGQNAQRVA